MLRLGINIDHVATLRQARGGDEPDPVRAALVCQKAGAYAIVMHLREDRRHIRDRDVFRVKNAVTIKVNLEMSIDAGIVKVASRLRPEQVTLVPERRQERTTEGGLDLFAKKSALARCLKTFQEKRILVSLFIDPDSRQIDQAKKLGADAIELHTGDYANQTSPTGARREFERLKKAVSIARQCGLVTHAGHGLDYQNVARLKSIKGIEEFNIGYSIITRSLWVGLDKAVKEMLALIR